ncbi:MAG: hypothetical protein IJF92_04170 [Bacilli bacterium]|nr:hypothetical protein [Bacilli bacterium]
MKNNSLIIKRLTFENYIWLAFIIISALDIYADELIKKDLLYNDKKSKEKADKLFLGLTALSMLIYLYFLARNFYDYKKYNSKSYQVRLIGSIFILIGTICFLYFQITTKQQDSSSNI